VGSTTSRTVWKNVRYWWLVSPCWHKTLLFPNHCATYLNHFVVNQLLLTLRTFDDRRASQETQLVIEDRWQAISKQLLFPTHDNLSDTSHTVHCVWNVMAHAQKTDFVFRRNGRVHLNRQGASVQSTAGSRGVRISCSNAAYTKFRGRVKSTGYPLHSPVSPSLPLPCVTVCHHISTGVYITVSELSEQLNLTVVE